MKYLKLFEQYDDPFGEEDDNPMGLKNGPPTNIPDQIEQSTKWYRSLYGTTYAREKVLYHMFFGYGTEYEWDHGKLIDQYSNERTMYDERLWRWEHVTKPENLKRIKSQEEFYEQMKSIAKLNPNDPSVEKYLKKITDDIQELKDEMETFDPFYVKYPQEEEPLTFKNPEDKENTGGSFVSGRELHYSERFSPIFDLPDDIDQEYLEAGLEILTYIINDIKGSTSGNNPKYYIELTKLRKDILKKFEDRLT